jgi:hypothetical protein
MIIKVELASKLTSIFEVSGPGIKKFVERIN